MKVLDRRTVLRGAGGIAVALPFLDAMARPRPARAAARARHFVVFFSANGTVMENWMPTGGETSFTLSEILSPLQNHRNDILVLRGLDNEISYRNPINGHDMGMTTMLTGSALKVGPGGLDGFGQTVDGSAAGPSIDQAIAKTLGAGTKFPSLAFSVESTTIKLGPTVLRMSYRAPFDPIVPEDDPAKAFARLFGDSAQSAAEIQRLQRRRKSVLDAVLVNYDGLATRLGADDRGRLERHATSIRELEQQLSTTGAGSSCHGLTPAAPTVSTMLHDCLKEGSIPGKCVGDFPAVGKAQLDLITLALACGLTHVATMQYSTAESKVVHSWIPVTGEHHLMSHDTSAKPSLTKINKWYAQQFNYLLDKLAAVQDEGGGTLLDNSVVFWCNELSDGATHSRRDLAYVLAGRGGGTLRPGRLVKATGQPHNQLLAAFLNMFGAGASSFGDAAYPGVLSGLG